MRGRLALHGRRRCHSSQEDRQRDTLKGKSKVDFFYCTISECCYSSNLNNLDILEFSNSKVAETRSGVLKLAKKIKELKVFVTYW